MLVKQKVITLGSNRELLAHLEAEMDELAVSILRAPSAAAALTMHGTFGVDLVIAALPLEDGDADDLLDGLRRSGEGPVPQLLVLATGETGAQCKLEGQHVTVISAEQPLPELLSQCARFFRASPRAAERIMARLEVSVGSESKLRFVQMRDISSTGLRVATQELLAVGTWVKLEFTLPGDRAPIRADAEVVRTTSRRKEGATGMGIRFTAFDSDGGERLRKYIESRVRKAETR